MSHALVPDHAQSRIHVRVPSPRTTNRVRDPDRAPVLHDPTQGLAIARSRMISHTISPVLHLPKITITLRSVMKAWRIESKCALFFLITCSMKTKTATFGEKIAPQLYPFFK